MKHLLLRKALDILKTLVEFDTRSNQSNLELIGLARDYLAGFGIESSPIYDARREKANLYAAIGPQDRAGLCLSGLNVIPDHAELEFEIRNLPGDDVEGIARIVYSYAQCALVRTMDRTSIGKPISHK